MPLQIAPLEPHPPGEVVDPRRAAAHAVFNAPLPVDTHGRRYHVEWYPTAPVTPLGRVVFFCQFLATAGRFHDWVQTCPLQFRSNNAPTHTNLLGTIVLAVLSGHQRYSHITALRADRVNPPGLGMDQMCSKDSVRRAFPHADPVAVAAWHAQALRQTYLPALRHPWIMDLDATVKTIYGHQEGAEVGYNPHQRGRPSHVYHSLFVRGLRVVLNVDVRPGKQHGATYSRPNLWAPGPTCPPTAGRGCCAATAATGTKDCWPSAKPGTSGISSACGTPRASGNWSNCWSSRAAGSPRSTAGKAQRAGCN